MSGYSEPRGSIITDQEDDQDYDQEEEVRVDMLNYDDREEYVQPTTKPGCNLPLTIKANTTLRQPTSTAILSYRTRMPPVTIIFEHPRSYPRNSENRYICAFRQPCDKTFECPNSVDRHIKTVHLKIREYQCETCTRAFSDKRRRDGHITNTNPKFKDCYAAYTSGLVLTSKQLLDRNAGIDGRSTAPSMVASIATFSESSDQSLQNSFDPPGQDERPHKRIRSMHNRVNLEESAASFIPPVLGNSYTYLDPEHGTSLPGMSRFTVRNLYNGESTAAPSLVPTLNTKTLLPRCGQNTHPARPHVVPPLVQRQSDFNKSPGIPSSAIYNSTPRVLFNTGASLYSTCPEGRPQLSCGVDGHNSKRNGTGGFRNILSLFPNTSHRDNQPPVPGFGTHTGLTLKASYSSPPRGPTPQRQEQRDVAGAEFVESGGPLRRRCDPYVFDFTHPVDSSFGFCLPTSTVPPFSGQSRSPSSIPNSSTILSAADCAKNFEQYWALNFGSGLGLGGVDSGAHSPTGLPASGLGLGHVPSVRHSGPGSATSNESGAHAQALHPNPDCFADLESSFMTDDIPPFGLTGSSSTSQGNSQGTPDDYTSNLEDLSDIEKMESMLREFDEYGQQEFGTSDDRYDPRLL
ncbi:hypothetical protein BKA61DRAFT_680129 [Leptodontidium sp. MPI-SDFR-AT-0119]|nr:hypothetical protein BKA61DRAFT_680129 [Leptodontidium sp. MPI-SDFR-AT-0119]